MKFVLLLVVAMTTLVMVQGKGESVAELRKMRALGYGHGGNGHSFGGDNGRDHPNGWNNGNNNNNVPVPAPVASPTSSEDTTVSFPASFLSSAVPKMCAILDLFSVSNEYTGLPFFFFFCHIAVGGE